MNKRANFILLVTFSILVAPSLRGQTPFYETEEQHNRIIDSCQDIINTVREDTVKVNTLLKLSNEYLQWGGLTKEGRETAQRAFQLAKELIYPKGVAESAILLGVNFSLEGKRKEAMQYYNDALVIFSQLNDYPHIIGTYINIATEYSNLKQNENAVRNLQTALGLAERYGDKKEIMNCYQFLGMFYMNTDPADNPKALKYYSMARKLAEEVGDKEAFHAFTNNLGIVYDLMGNYEAALRTYDGLEERTGQGPPVANLINAYNALHRFNESLDLARKRLINNANDRKRLPNSLELTGSIFFQMAQIPFNNHPDSVLKYADSALFYFDRATIIRKENNTPHTWGGSDLDYGTLHKIKARIFLDQKRPRTATEEEAKKAQEYFNSGLETALKKVDDKAVADIYIMTGELSSIRASLGPTKSNSRLYREAISLLEKGIRTARKIDNKTAIRDAYLDMAYAYKNMNEPENFYRYTDLYDKIKDSVNLDESENRKRELTLLSETMVGVVEENARHEKVMTKLKFEYAKKEDSLKYQQTLGFEQLKQQQLITLQNQQALKLKQALLDLSYKENQLSKLAFLKTESELKAEQSQRKEKEKQLTVAEQEKQLQAGQLKLQATELTLKENRIKAEHRQKIFYATGIAALGLVFFLSYKNIQTRQNARLRIADEKLKAQKAQSAQKLTELELQSLRAQLNPHFMFNSLNAIQELILKEDYEKSHIYLARFSDLLRMMLEQATQPFIPLEKEITLLAHYLSLEKLRIPDLDYNFRVDPAIDARLVIIPNMILQPYIENAIWHGLSHKKENKILDIRVSEYQHQVLLAIQDNGVGRKKATELKSRYRKEHKSKGMELLSKRFSLISREYNADIQTRITDLRSDVNGEATGTLVEILVPGNLTENTIPKSNDTDDPHR